MANSPQAKKRARQSEKSRVQNVACRSEFRTFIKKVVTAIESGDKDKATDLYKQTVPIIDRTASKGLIKPNKAARHKSRLNAKIKAL
ncbi:MAG: 30S ribosomal protein S20 [Thiohalomonadales bacterium]